MGLSAVTGSVGDQGGLDVPSSSWLPGPAFCGCFWLLFSKAWPQGEWLQNPRASPVLLVSGFRAPKTLRLLCTNWQVKPDPLVKARVLAGRAGCRSLTADSRNPRAPFRLLEGEVLVPDTVEYET